MYTLLLEPTDVLFFRDGRPMGGSLSGHGAAWPMPTTLNHALHAALHRAEFEQAVHKHVPGRSSVKREYSDHNREANGRKFGSLLTAGPFPVCPAGKWYFPRPLDAGVEKSTEITFLPLASTTPGQSSLPEPLMCPVANTKAPNKDKPEGWLDTAAYAQYLGGTEVNPQAPPTFIKDTCFWDAEHSIGIGIDATTATQNETQFYSASYLRLRQGWKLGMLGSTWDKDQNTELLEKLFPNAQGEIITGGQQRVCTASLTKPTQLSLPYGKTDGFTADRTSGKFLVKWVLLTPAIFPEIAQHKGGWLPSWVDTTGKVRLLDGPGKNAAKRQKKPEGKPIEATLVAAIIGKPIPITGYALPNEHEDKTRKAGGAKSTHLAVAPGSVYYFQCDTAEAAKALATALNWHGSQTPSKTILNRRSTLMGEKGFGLGVCSTWAYHSGQRPQ